MRKSSHAIEPIRLLVDENGGKVMRTFEGEWLVGYAADEGHAFGRAVESKLAGIYTGCNWWSVIRARSGKFVAYRENVLRKTTYLYVLDSFEDLKKVVPPRIADEAGKAAGLIAEPTFPEIPLDV